MAGLRQPRRLNYDRVSTLDLQHRQGVEVLATDWGQEVIHLLRDHPSRWEQMFGQSACVTDYSVTHPGPRPERWWRQPDCRYRALCSAASHSGCGGIDGRIPTIAVDRARASRRLLRLKVVCSVELCPLFIGRTVRSSGSQDPVTNGPSHFQVLVPCQHRQFAIPDIRVLGDGDPNLHPRVTCGLP